jgi:hypothetical protein
MKTRNSPIAKFLAKSYPITDLDWTLNLQDIDALRISRHLSHEDVKFVSTTQRPSLPQEKKVPDELNNKLPDNKIFDFKTQPIE